MKGPAGVGTTYATFFYTKIQATIARLATENGPILIGQQLVDPTPQLIVHGQRAADQIGLGDWPFLLVVPTRTPTMRLDRLETTEKWYRSDYETRVFVWARGDGFEETAAVRDRLTLAVMETLLQHLQVADWLRTEENSLSADYSDVVVDDTLQSTIAATVVTFTATAHERVALGPGYSISDTEVVVNRLPHPALQ